MNKMKDRLSAFGAFCITRMLPAGIVLPVILLTALSTGGCGSAGTSAGGEPPAGAPENGETPGDDGARGEAAPGNGEDEAAPASAGGKEAADGAEQAVMIGNDEEGYFAPHEFGPLKRIIDAAPENALALIVEDADLEDVHMQGVEAGEFESVYWILNLSKERLSYSLAPAEGVFDEEKSGFEWTLGEPEPLGLLEPGEMAGETFVTPETMPYEALVFEKADSGTKYFWPIYWLTGRQGGAAVYITDRVSCDGGEAENTFAGYLFAHPGESMTQQIREDMRSFRRDGWIPPEKKGFVEYPLVSVGLSGDWKLIFHRQEEADENWFELYRSSDPDSGDGSSGFWEYDPESGRLYLLILSGETGEELPSDPEGYPVLWNPETRELRIYPGDSGSPFPVGDESGPIFSFAPRPDE